MCASRILSQRSLRREVLVSRGAGLVGSFGLISPTHLLTNRRKGLRMDAGESGYVISARVTRKELVILEEGF